MGYDVLYAENGYKGQQLINNQGTIDVLITDIGLPGINGSELATQALSEHPTSKCFSSPVTTET